jgi:predicted RNA binding protein YcfA (HicA-like mRNA interferase family)
MDEARAETAARKAEVAKNTTGVARGRGGAGNLNPTSWEELITMLRADGFEVEQGGKHLAVSNSNGDRLVTLPVTASDHRSLLNALSQLRRTLGVPLRRNTRGQR